MRKSEMKQLQAVLDMFEHLQDECDNMITFMNEHNFIYEKQAYEIRRQAYHKCFLELQYTLSGQQVNDWTAADTAIARQLVDFFKDGTVVLQNDCNFYASWLKHKILKED